LKLTDLPLDGCDLVELRHLARILADALEY
jgi:hypothetical protein